MRKRINLSLNINNWIFASFNKCSPDYARDFASKAETARGFAGRVADCPLESRRDSEDLVP